MKKIIILFLICGKIFANDFNYNGSIISSFGDSYDFYSFAENRLDINMFYKNLSAWVQYEYSNPPEIGFTTNDIRKFRLEYSDENFNIKLGDLYEFWGRGLVLNQIDDQITNFDNGTRGLFLGYTKGDFTLSHINGNADIWDLGENDNRLPYFNNNHNMFGNHLQYDFNSYSIGLTQLNSNEEHQKKEEGTAFVNHKIKGIYGSASFTAWDFFFEYVDKQSFEKTDFYNDVAHDTLKHGYGMYSNLNLYFGNWGLTTEYKQYSFDWSHTDLNADDYGNRIGFQMMPTLGRETNMTLMGRAVHLYNYNDERGVQAELTGSLPLGLNILGQYAHLSRNDTWMSLTSTDWERNALNNFLPSSDPSSLPFWENYFELSGFLIDSRFYYRLGRGNNKDILYMINYFDGFQSDMVTNSYWLYDTTTFNSYGYEFEIIDSMEVFDTSFSDPYKVEAKYWQETKTITYPLELSYTFNNGYAMGFSFEYQERTKKNVNRGNATFYSSTYEKWNLIDSENPDSFIVDYQTQLYNLDGGRERLQINRMVTLTVSKASKWSLTLVHDQSSAFDGPKTVDPYYNPLEALIYGDIKYFTGERKRTSTPKFGQQRWVSVELSYNISSSHRLTIMYGSIQGGLFCSNGICRQIPPYNDGIRFNYSMIF